MRKIVEKIKKFAVRFKALEENNKGIGVVEILLILVVLIGLVVIFKSQIGSVINSAFSAINNGVSNIVQ